MVSAWRADTKDTLPADTTNVFYSSGTLTGGIVPMLLLLILTPSLLKRLTSNFFNTNFNHLSYLKY
jgi:hypothetical protein